MNVLLIITLLLAAATVILTASQRRLKPRTSLAVNASLASIGCVALVALVILFGQFNTSSETALAETDFRYFLKISLISEGVLLFMTLVPSLMIFVDDKTGGYSDFLRKVLPSLSSVLMLMAGFLAYPLVRHVALTVSVFVYCAAVCEAMIMRLPYVVVDIKRCMNDRQSGKSKKSGKKDSRNCSRRKGKL